MKTGWLRAIALVFSPSLALVLVVKAGCGGEPTPAAGKITPEATASGSAVSSAAGASQAPPTASTVREQDEEFFGTGKSGPVRRKPRSAEPAQSPANDAQ